MWKYEEIRLSDCYINWNSIYDISHFYKLLLATLNMLEENI